MDPLTISLLASGASSILGGMGANEANKRNADIALLNYYAQQSAQRAATRESRRQQGEAHLGTTDAAGNQTRFVPGVGWVTDLSDTQQAIQGGTEAEQLRQLGAGAQRAEAVDARSAGRRGREDVLATEAERELRAARRPDEEGLRQLLLARGAETRNRSADAVGEQIARQAIRAGGGAGAAELYTAARGASDQSAARQAGVDATLTAREEADNQFAGERDAASSMYDYFRRASTSGTAAPQGYMPSGPQRSSSGVADQGLINSLARAPQQEYAVPNNAFASTTGDLSSALQGYFNTRENSKMRDAIMGSWGKGLGNTGSIR